MKRNEDGTYTVRRRRLSLAAWAGEVDLDELVLDTPEDAARAARLLNRNALADYVPVAPLTARDRRWLEEHRGAQARGSQVHSPLALEGQAWFLKAEGRAELSGSLFGLLYYSFRKEGQAAIARRIVTESETRP